MYTFICIPHVRDSCPLPLQIDLPLADVNRVTEQLHNAFGFNPEEALKVQIHVHVHVLCTVVCMKLHLRAAEGLSTVVHVHVHVH